MIPRTVHKLIVVLVWVALVGGACFGAAAEDRSGVSVVKHEHGFTVTAPGYQVLIGEDGNLHSFRIGEVEMLDDRVGVSLGAFAYSTAPLKLPRVTSPERATIEATEDGRHLLRYQFGSKQVTITLVNRSSAPLSYFVVLSPEVTIVRNARTGEAAAAPANARWPEASFYTRQGEFLTVKGGDRVWGPWLDRQVWESARIPAEGGEIQIVLEGGKGEQPKAALEQLLGLRTTVVTPSGRLALGGVELSAEVENRADETLEGSVAMELSACRSELVVLASQPLLLAARQVAAPISFRARVEAPDFYTARMSVTVRGRQVAKNTSVVGYRMDEIVPRITRPADFHDFWQRLVTQAREHEADLELYLTPDEQASGDEVRVSRATYPGIGGKTIYGWYLTPTQPGKYPALLCLSGYGARTIAPPVFLAQKGYAVLAINVRGNPVDTARVKSYDDYLTVGIESPETYVYREIVGQALRGLWALAKREEADPERLGIVGVSEGGGVGLMLAALEPRVRAVSADAPMLADFPLSVRRAKWPYQRVNQYVREHPEQAAQVATTLSYFDGANFAPGVKAPVLLSVGFLDQVSLPTAVYGLYNLLGGEKEVRPFPNAGHEGGGQEWWSYKLSWLERHLAPRPAALVGDARPALPSP